MQEWIILTWLFILLGLFFSLSPRGNSIPRPPWWRVNRYDIDDETPYRWDWKGIKHYLLMCLLTILKRSGHLATPEAQIKDIKDFR